MWKGQGGRCFECARPVKLEETAKRAMCFNVLCIDCYLHPMNKPIIIYDDLVSYDNNPGDVSTR